MTTKSNTKVEGNSSKKVVNMNTQKASNVVPEEKANSAISDLDKKLEKIRAARKELDEFNLKAREVTEGYSEILKEEQELIDKVKMEIQAIAASHNMFCGVILTNQDILGIMDVALKNKGQTVEIPFHLYLK